MEWNKLVSWQEYERDNYETVIIYLFFSSVWFLFVCFSLQIKSLIIITSIVNIVAVIFIIDFLFGKLHTSSHNIVCNTNQETKTGKAALNK